MLKDQGMFLTADPYKRSIRMNHDSGAIVTEYVPRSYFLSVRLIRDTALVIYPVVYGYLYNWYAAVDVRNIASDGWHVPTTTEIFTTLRNYCLSVTDGLKEPGYVYWNFPNNNSTNVYKFNARGSGLRANGFFQLGAYFIAWTNQSATANDANHLTIYNTSNVFNDLSPAGPRSSKYSGMSIRLIKDSTTLTHGQTGTYTGNDGKVYRTICIGTQEWLADNLCETLYRDGSPIPEVTDNAAWAGLATGARCSYNNDESLAHA